MYKFVCKIFPECSLIVEFLQGNISWLDIIEMKQSEVLKPGYSPRFNLITDVRNVKILSNDLQGMGKYLDYLKNNHQVTGHRKTAILTNNSKQVIHSEMLKVEASGLPMYLKTVSTYEAAFEWTNLDKQYQHEVTNFMESLRMPACVPMGNA